MSSTDHHHQHAIAPAADVVRDVLLRNIDEVWGAGRVDVIDELFAVDVVDHNPAPGGPAGVAGIRAAVTEFRNGVPDLTMTLHSVTVDGDRGADHWTLNGTHTGTLFGIPATGRRIEFSGMDTVRVGADGRITDIWHIEEIMSLMGQLGALPGMPAGAA